MDLPLKFLQSPDIILWLHRCTDIRSTCVCVSIKHFCVRKNILLSLIIPMCIPEPRQQQDPDSSTSIVKLQPQNKRTN